MARAILVKMLHSLRMVVVIFGLVFLFGACSSAPLKSAGTVCNSDSECGSGLSCLGAGSFTDAGCNTVAKSCSKPCTLNSDCASLGSRFMCLPACDGSRVCGATF